MHLHGATLPSYPMTTLENVFSTLSLGSWIPVEKPSNKFNPAVELRTII